MAGTWQKAKKGFGTALKLGELLIKLNQHTQFLGQERETSLAQIQRKVETMTEQELARYEIEFLELSSMVSNTKLRKRSMELYAGFKTMETAHYKKFQGFTTEGEALAA